MRTAIANHDSSDSDPIPVEPRLSAEQGSKFAPLTNPQTKEGPALHPSQPQLVSSSSGSNCSRPGKTAKSSFKSDLGRLRENGEARVGIVELEANQDSSSAPTALETRNYLKKRKRAKHTGRITPHPGTPMSGVPRRSQVTRLVNKRHENEVCIKGTPIGGSTGTRQNYRNDKLPMDVDGTSSTASRDHHKPNPRKQLCANNTISNEPTIGHLIKRRSRNKEQGARRDIEMKVMLQQRNMPPRLKKLVRLALKEISEVNEVSEVTEIEMNSMEEPTCVETAGIEQLPIFLWPVEHALSEIDQTSLERKDRTQVPDKEDGETDLVETEYQSSTAHHREERMLHDMLKEMHRSLLNLLGHRQVNVYTPYCMIL